MIIWCWSGIWGTWGNQIVRTWIHDFAYIYVLYDSALQHLSALNSSDAWNHITSYPWLLYVLAVHTLLFGKAFYCRKWQSILHTVHIISHPICFPFYRRIWTCSHVSLEYDGLFNMIMRKLEARRISACPHLTLPENFHKKLGPKIQEILFNFTRALHIHGVCYNA